VAELNHKTFDLIAKIKIHKNDGDLFQRENKPLKALACYKKALSYKPTLLDVGLFCFKAIVKELAPVYDRIGQLYEWNQQLSEAILAYANAIQCDPDNAVYFIHFAQSTRFAKFNQPNEEIKSLILLCLTHPHVNPQSLAIPALSFVKLDPEFDSLYALARKNDFKDVFSTFQTQKTQQFLNDPFLLTLLNKALLPDDQMETLLRFLRKAYLIAKAQHPAIFKLNVPFLYALAAQCHLNEYVYEEDKEERQILKSKIDFEDNVQIALLGCYTGLANVADLKLKSQTIDIEKDSLFFKLINQQIKEVQLEKELKKTISRFSIKNRVSKLVQKQYEENPYPQWIGIHRYESSSFEDYIQQQLPSLKPKSRVQPLNPHILIAGCGTGYHAISTAVKFKNSNVLAIDLSLSSLAYASRKAKELQVSNIKFVQADILNLKEYSDEKFDIIECSGVLHHMKDPFLGLTILSFLLKPSGWMCLGLYSELARQDISLARQFIAQNQYKPYLEEIRQCRQHLLSLENENPLHRVTESVDFYSTSACRDLLFNVQESYFNLPQIKKMLKALDLDFQGFCLDPNSISHYYREQFPNDPEMKDLDKWHPFEINHPDTFLNMYQFWVTLSL
jgi:ubiquinone/menaquinone biosynthesis C-methylase UbiE